MEKDNRAYAHAEKAYMQGTIFPFVKVGMQKVNLTPTVTVVDGKKVTTPNAPVYVYDTSGPFSDPNIEVDLKRDCPACAKNGSFRAVTWNSCLPSPQHTAKCAVTIRRWTTCASSISPCPTVQKPASAARKCITRNRAS